MDRISMFKDKELKTKNKEYTTTIVMLKIAN